MKIMNKNASCLIRDEGETAYRFCLLLTGRPQRARKAVFEGAQLSTEAAETLSLEEDRRLLYRRLFLCSEDGWYQRGSSRLVRSAFRETLAAPIDDALWRLMKRPMRQKAAFFLVHVAGFSLEDAALILRCSGKRAEKYLSPFSGQEERLCRQIQALPLDEAWLEQLEDDLLLRLRERNIPLENRLLRLRSRFYRLVPWLALFVLLFCVAAVWYSARRAAVP